MFVYDGWEYLVWVPWGGLWLVRRACLILTHLLDLLDGLKMLLVFQASRLNLGLGSGSADDRQALLEVLVKLSIILKYHES